MRALVTGAAGFIGSHLCEALIGSGCEVVGLDDLSAGSLTNIENLEMTFVHAKVDDAIAERREHFDVIFHLAGRVGPTRVLHQRSELLREHAIDLLALIELAERNRAHLVFTSSSEVYGCNTSTPFREGDELTLGPPSHPRWAYAASKLWCEHAILAWCEERGGRGVVARLFNTVGARQVDGSGFVLPAFARAALSGGRLEVHGDGMQRRCFTHVADVVSALLALAGCQDARGQVINVGSPHETTIIQAANDIIGHVSSAYARCGTIELVPWRCVPERPQGMDIRVPDTSKLEALTGFRFSDRWPEIVADVCAWQAQQLGIERTIA